MIRMMLVGHEITPGESEILAAKWGSQGLTFVSAHPQTLEEHVDEMQKADVVLIQRRSKDGTLPKVPYRIPAEALAQKDHYQIDHSQTPAAILRYEPETEAA